MTVDQDGKLKLSNGQLVVGLEIWHNMRGFYDSPSFQARASIDHIDFKTKK